MNATKIIIWPDQLLLASLIIPKPFAPVMAWDEVANKRSNVQQTNAWGVPLWKAKAKVAMGYDGDDDLIEVRVASRTQPVPAPIDEGRLMDLVTGRVVSGEANA